MHLCMHGVAACYRRTAGSIVRLHGYDANGVVVDVRHEQLLVVVHNGGDSAAECSAAACAVDVADSGDGAAQARRCG